MFYFMILRKIKYNGGNHMKALLVKPKCKPEVINLKDTLEDWYKYIGRPVEFIYPFSDLVAIICNEEGKLNGMPYNRPLFKNYNEVYDIIAGNFLIVGIKPPNEDDGKICGLSDKLIEKYSEYFKQCYEYFMYANTLHIIPYDSIE